MTSKPSRLAGKTAEQRENERLAAENQRLAAELAKTKAVRGGCGKSARALGTALQERGDRDEVEQVIEAAFGEHRVSARGVPAVEQAPLDSLSASAAAGATG